MPPPTSGDDLLDRPVHVAVRDYPEVLAVLRREGVELASVGGSPLRSLEDSEALVARILEVTAWRMRSAGGGGP